jgi:protein-tyrosine phosphatase
MEDRRVLFLCTGNYYRSRTAEELFNHYAQKRQLTWLAESKGLKENMGTLGNIGTISHLAVNFLNGIQVPILGKDRSPVSVMEEDFDQYQRVICLDKKEHLPMMNARFPGFRDQVEYWEIPDVDLSPSFLMLPQIHELVLKLVKELAPLTPSH